MVLGGSEMLPVLMRRRLAVWPPVTFEFEFEFELVLLLAVLVVVALTLLALVLPGDESLGKVGES